MQHVMITGAAKNTGFGIARYFLDMGWAIHITSRMQKEIEASHCKLQAMHPKANIFSYAMDLDDPESIRNTFSRVKRNSSQLHAFIQNAANLGMGGHFLDEPPEYFDAVIHTNVCGGFRACREAALMMRETGGGSIVTLSSITYRYIVRDRLAYITSKGAIVSMTKALALDCSPYNIRVNCVLPGTISTDRWDRLSDDEKGLRRTVYPLNESTFNDVASAVYFLASDQSKNITGIELVVDGGASIMAAAEAFINRKPLPGDDV